MLRNKHRMTAKRRLLAIVFRLRIGQTLTDKIPGMLDNDSQTFVSQIIEILTLKMKFAAKGGSCQCRKKLVRIAHKLQLEQRLQAVTVTRANSLPATGFAERLPQMLSFPGLLLPRIEMLVQSQNFIA